MKLNKKIICGVIIIIVIIIAVVVMVGKNKGDKSENNVEFTEYTPQEEISNEQLRQTLVTLYFKNKETGELNPEARMIDSKILLNNPYYELTKLLVDGPKNDSLEKIIPDNTKINKVELDKGIVYIDFSEDFINAGDIGVKEESKIIYSIVNTLTQLTEVNGIKILINGEENKGFKSGNVTFNEIFVSKTEGII